MAVTKYTYSISDDTANGSVSEGKLHSDILASSIITAIDNIETADDVLSIWFKDALSTDDEATLSSIVSNHDGIPEPSERVIKALIQEENIPTGGHYQAKGFEIVVPASDPVGDITDLEFSFPYPISLLSCEYATTENMDGDRMCLSIAPDTTVGSLSSNADIDDTVISVSESMMQYMESGYCLKLSDGTNENDLGAIVGIDRVNNTVTVENSLTNNFLASTPTYVKRSVKMVPCIYIQGNSRVQLGESKIGGSYIPANTTFKVQYENNEGSAKKFRFIFEYLY